MALCSIITNNGAQSIHAGQYSIHTFIEFVYIFIYINIRGLMHDS